MPLYTSLAIAPMIDWTYSAFRISMRLLAPSALLYTEMQTTGAVQHNPRKALDFHPMEHPIALQLGGADPKALVLAAKMAQDAGFDEVNLNLGCPSDKVQAGRFGACLMREPAQVADCLSAMRAVVQIPVSAKTRIGIDQEDSYDFFSQFIDCLVAAGCQKLIVHARKAWLSGLNPKQNRTIPPLHYEYVYRIKEAYPDLPIHINGNINPQSIPEHLQKVDGVMLGRLACDNPYAIATIHKTMYPESTLPSRSVFLQHYWPYVLHLHQQGLALGLLLKPIFNLAHGLAGTGLWKKHLMLALQAKQIPDLSALLEIMTNIESSRQLGSVTIAP